MTHASAPAVPARRLSEMASGLTGSRILGIAAEIRALTAAGQRVCNLTVGDFAPAQFRIPAGLERRIEEALRRGETNYPPSNGLPQLREAVCAFYRDWLGLAFGTENVLVVSGSRPGLYATYRSLVDPGDRVVFAVPSWNNPHYVEMTGAIPVPVACGPETDFLPTRALLEPHVRTARLIAVNSPLNPCGTALSAEALGGIADLVVEENARRAAVGERPLYLMYDQVYWTLTFGDTTHVNPLSLRPDVAPYTVLVDGISKAFAATGLRVGWIVGPADVVAKMSDLIGHVGAWAPRAEQAATAEFLGARAEIEAYHAEMKAGVQARLDALFGHLSAMAERGVPVEVIPPQGAIYLTARFPFHGTRTADGTVLETNEDVRAWLLREAGFAVVPFQAFGVEGESGWFRLSVGAVSLEEIEETMPRVAALLEDAVMAAR